jgi:hypothetical protein
VVKQADRVTAQQQWVLDGNFDDQRHFVWQRADTIVWLDFSEGAATISSHSSHRKTSRLARAIDQQYVKPFIEPSLR